MHIETRDFITSMTRKLKLNERRQIGIGWKLGRIIGKMGIGLLIKQE